MKKQNKQTFMYSESYKFREQKSTQKLLKALVG